MHAKGQGMEQNHTEAVARWEKLAMQGHADAQFNLGVMYANGEGMPQVFLQAYAHFSIAAANDHKRAAGMRDKVAKKLAPEAVLKAQALARTLWESWKTQ